MTLYSSVVRKNDVDGIHINEIFFVGLINNSSIFKLTDYWGDVNFIVMLTEAVLLRQMASLVAIVAKLCKDISWSSWIAVRPMTCLNVGRISFHSKDTCPVFGIILHLMLISTFLRFLQQEEHYACTKYFMHRSAFIFPNVSLFSKLSACLDMSGVGVCVLKFWDVFITKDMMNMVMNMVVEKVIALSQGNGWSWGKTIGKLAVITEMAEMAAKVAAVPKLGVRMWQQLLQQWWLF